MFKGLFKFKFNKSLPTNTHNIKYNYTIVQIVKEKKKAGWLDRSKILKKKHISGKERK